MSFLVMSCLVLWVWVGGENLLECNLRSSVWGPLPLAFVSEHVDHGDHLMPALCLWASQPL